jgi:Flp pilus assembly protein TadB
MSRQVDVRWRDKEPLVKQQSATPAVITSARASRSDEIRRRQQRYLLSMGVRTACFVLAVVASGPLRWVLIAAALLLPYVAVVVANTSTHRETSGPAAYVPDSAPALEGPPAASTNQP